MKIFKTIIKSVSLCATSMLMFVTNALATTAGPGLPWEGPLATITASLQGPVATSLSVLALVGSAASLMFFEVGKGMRWFVMVVLAFSIISSAFGLMAIFGLTSALV